MRKDYICLANNTKKGVQDIDFNAFIAWIYQIKSVLCFTHADEMRQAFKLYIKSVPERLFYSYYWGSCF